MRRRLHQRRGTGERFTRRLAEIDWDEDTLGECRDPALGPVLPRTVGIQRLSIDKHRHVPSANLKRVSFHQT